jgi:hypothetical protein
MAKEATVVQLMNRVLADTFAHESWSAWRTVLSAAFGLPLTDDQLALFKDVSYRETAPTEQASELWLLLGRRSGKSIIAALIALYFACVRQYLHTAAGEQLTVAVIAADRKQGRIIKSYIAGLAKSAPALAALVVNETADSVTFRSGVRVEIVTASHRVSRGYSYACVICDELAFWRSEDSADPDREILTAVRPSMATVDGSMLIVLSSVYSRRGETWRAFKDSFGKSSDPVLVIKAPTQVFNPTVSEDVIAQAYKRDPVAAAAEYGAEFRADLESFIDLETVDGATVSDRVELPPVDGVVYHGFLDAAGGSGRDSMTLAVAHVNTDGIAVLDLIREWKPPFSPESVTAEAASVVKPYTSVLYADRWGGDWVAQAFAKVGISVAVCPFTKSELYLSLLPLLNSHKVELLDNDRLRQQLASLERRTARGGRDSVDHAVGAHDDAINASAGALCMAARSVERDISVWGGDLEPTPEAETEFRQRKADELKERVLDGAGWFPSDRGAPVGRKSRYWR